MSTFSELMESLLAARVVGSLEVSGVPLLAQLAGEGDPEVWLAAALAMAAPRGGHVCVALGSVGPAQLVQSEEHEAPVAAVLPADRVAWVDKVRASPLVGGLGEPAAPLQLVGDRLYLHRWWSYEARLAGRLRARLAASEAAASSVVLSAMLPVLFQRAPEVPDRQRLAAEVGAQQGLAVITGGPGTGKTWTVRNLLAVLYAQHLEAGARDPLRVALAAPTGKAAARLRESLESGLQEWCVERAGPALQAAGVGSVEALTAWLRTLKPTTVHRLVGVNPSRPGLARHSAERPVPFDVVVVDEASMVDLSLMTLLVEAVAPSTRLVLLGDRYQLASVQAGSVLADLCRAGEAGGPLASAVVFLQHSRRFAAGGGIARCASACVAPNDHWQRFEDVLKSAPEDVRWLRPRQGAPPDALGSIVDDVFVPLARECASGPMLQDDDAWALQRLHDLGGLRLLCAHREGALGVDGLNRWVRRRVASKVRTVRPDHGLQPGVPVMVLRSDARLGRFNGDVGLVVNDAEGRLRVVFDEGAGRVQWLAPARLPEHDVVFANTIHKSQGSEYNHAVVVLPDRPSPILTRELLYTGLTRAKHRLTLVSTASSLEASLSAGVRRASGLAEQLMQPT